MKILMLICDGMADRPLKELGGKTPLEAASKHNLDALAAQGICGMLDPIAPGVRVGSDTTHLALLGYNPYEVYTGRGPFEAAGVGLEVKTGDIAFRCNFATVDENLIVQDRRAGRISYGTLELAEAINKIKIKGVKLFFKESVAHRGALVLRGKNLSECVSDSDPHETGIRVSKVTALNNSRAAKNTAKILNEFTSKVYKALKNHEVNLKLKKEGKMPANMILLRGAGRALALQSFANKYNLHAACMATTGIIKGIASSIGMEVLEVEKDYRARVNQALEVLEKFDFLLMNIKECDEASHDHDAQKKVKLIEEIDAALEPLIEFASQNYLAILSDHTTSVTLGDHTGDAVPVAICGPEVRSDEVQAFDERSAAKGGLGRIRGQDLMQLLIDLTNRSKKFGA